MTLRLAMAVALVSGWGLALLVAGPATDARSPLEMRAERPGRDLPVVRAIRYRMAGGIRPLLFWIGRDRVGTGFIVWREGADGAVAYEVLMGTDPAIAPRALNRWGYLAEEVRGSTAAVLGIIVSSDEETYDGAVSRLRDGAKGAVFKTISAQVTPDASHARISLLRPERDLTVGDVDAALIAARHDADGLTPRVTARPPGTRSGFVAAMSEILRDSVAAHRRGSSVLASLDGTAIPYVYGDRLHDLTVRSLRADDERRIGERTYRHVIEGRFHTRSRTTGRTFPFDVVYGTADRFAEVPLLIQYRPRWWLRVELILEEDEAR